MKRFFTASAAIATTALLMLTSAGQAQGTYELNIGSLAPKGTPWMALLEQMETQIEGDSGGAINVIIRPPGVMGEVEMVRETRKGDRLQGCAVTTAAIAEGGNVPQLSLVEMPYLFNDSAEADYVLDNTLWDEYGKVLRRRGFVLAVWSENGWRSFATKGGAIRTPDDLKKYKMRSQESDVHMAMYKAFGAQAVQKPMTEVLTSLQSNVIDGLDNTALYIQAGGLGEPLDYFTLSKHIYQPAAIVYSYTWFKELPENLQEILRKPKSLTQGGREAIRAEEKEMMQVFDIYDVEVIELSAEEREAFAAVGRTTHDTIAAGIEGGPELLGKIRASIAEYQGQ